MVEANQSSEGEHEIPPLDEESVFIADYEKLWEFEGHVKEVLIFDLL